MCPLRQAGQRWDLALVALHDMRCARLEPNIRTCNMAIGGLDQRLCLSAAQGSLPLCMQTAPRKTSYARVRTRHPAHPLLAAQAISACQAAARWDGALALLGSALGSGLRPDVVSYNTLAIGRPAQGRRIWGGTRSASEPKGAGFQSRLAKLGSGPRASDGERHCESEAESERRL